ncbi:DUF1036 domain-containing protein [Paracoccus sp. M683]|uniref:DUF1036 domain-containing protein n=1 Tax=Paracoccus sp. M683 TaxID=2594268 RepID=UPI00117E844A|nr:DUF1036 domain-containing protein [Paracoccus sp. M683]TRW99578.1 DUF1036 domain-containing protein [Paracoccus sp. M683]
MLRHVVPLLFALICWAGPARAEFKVCNQSFDVLNLAFGQPTERGFRTEGWWRVAPNQCATLIRGTLSVRYLYLFASDVFGKSVLPGSVPMCVSPRRFRIEGEQDCLLRGHIEARFVEIDTGQEGDWTVFVAPQP